MGGKSSSVVVGYWYSMGIHMGLGRGPVDEFIEIKVGERTAWKSHDDPVTESRSIYINAPELFGGEKAEGGIQGRLDIMMGEPTQPRNSRLAAMLGGLVPAFRGVVTLFFDGRICALNPYPKPWKFRVRRSKTGWDGDVWYPEVIDIYQCTNVKAMNPAHIIYECATNRSWGRGLPRSRIDHISFTQAADRLMAECFGLCVRWNRADDLGAFVQMVIDHIGGALYIDRGTGLLTLKLIRDDYDPADVPTFDYNSGLLDITEDSTSSSDGLTNEVVVTYRDAVTDEERQVRAQNIASIQAQKGAMNTLNKTYAGIACPDLALRVAQRDLRAAGLSLKRFTCVFDRRAWKIAPGGVFRITAPDRGLGDIILRAGRIQDSTDGTGKITITAIEDVFGLPNVAFTEVQPGGHVPPSTDPVSITRRWLEVVNYRDMRRMMSNADFAARTPDTAYAMLIAAKPQPAALNYVPCTRRPDTGIYDPYGTAPFAVSGDVDAMGPYDTTMTVRNVTDFFKALIDYGFERGGAAMIGTEIVRMDSMLEYSEEEGWIRYQIGRGCIDTVPVAHPHGTVWVWYERDNASDRREYAPGEFVHAKFLTRTSTQVQDEADVTDINVEIDERPDRPYPPGKVQIGGAYPDVNPMVAGDIVITWAHRDRVIQADKLIDTTAADVGPEVGTTYTVNIRKASDDSLIRAYTGITGTTQTYSDADATTDGYETNIIVELYAIRDGLDSHQKHRIAMRHYPTGTTGFGWSFGTNYGG